MITKKSLQNLNGLLMLSAIDECQSKRKVAEITCSSIDTVNKYICNLEQSLGVQLVVNNAKGTYLTDRAKEIVEQVKYVQDVLDDIYNRHCCDNKNEGEVCGCLPMMLSSAMFPCGIAGFSEEHPEIKIMSLTTMDAPDYREVGVDFGIVPNLPLSARDFSLLYQKNVACSFFASAVYLEKYGRPKNAQDLLANHRIVEGLQNKNYFPKWQQFAQKAKNISFSSNSALAVTEAVKRGLGVGLLPSKFAGDGLVRLANLDNIFELNLYLIVNNRTKNLPRVRMITDYYKNILKQI